MAYSFTRASSMYMENATALISGANSTFFAHIYVSESSPTAPIVVLGVGASGNQYVYNTMYVDQSNRQLILNQRIALLSNALCYSGLFVPSGQWSRVGVAWTPNANPTVDDVYFVLGTSVVGPIAATHLWAASDRTAIGCNPASGRSQYFEGYIAEAAVWNACLSTAELAILGKGFRPIQIRPESCVSYWNLLRNTEDLFGLYPMTAYNTPTVTDHGPVIYPGFTGTGNHLIASANPPLTGGMIDMLGGMMG